MTQLSSKQITAWLHTYQASGGRIVDKVVTQSSDAEFHCLTVTLFCEDAPRK